MGLLATISISTATPATWRMRRLHLVLAIVSCGLISDAYAQAPPGGRARANSSPVSHDILRELDRATIAVAKRVLPAVVQISVSGFGPSLARADGGAIVERQRGIGSGVIVAADGYIITNAHVVTGAQRIQVVMRSVVSELDPDESSLLRRQRTFDARLVGVHPASDLALLKIDEQGLPFVPLKQEYKAQIGQTVLAVGSPAGLDHTLTQGIVSAVGRQADVDQPMIYIQTDTPMNAGNSGGALVDRDGNLIGINTFIVSRGGGSEGLGFAIPEPIVRFVYEELKERGRVRQTVIGAHAQTITPILAAGLKLPRDWGVIISDVLPGGPADLAGVRPQDVVVAIDNRTIDSLFKYATALFVHRHGAPVQMQVLRRGQVLKLSIPAVEGRSGLDSLAHLVDRNKLIGPLGIFVLELNRSMADAVPGLRSSSGMIVTAKADSTPAIEAGLAVGDVIRSINGAPIGTIDDFRSELERFRIGEPIVLELERQGRYQFVSFDME